LSRLSHHIINTFYQEKKKKKKIKTHKKKKKKKKSHEQDQLATNTILTSFKFPEITKCIRSRKTKNWIQVTTV